MVRIVPRDLEGILAREQFGSRMGFILVSAGCAVGLGNVWRFPYITGQYGGAAFVLLYLVFLVGLALPALIMEFACGRASQKGIARSFDVLEPEGTKWHVWKWFGLAGNYLLMMFYTVVTGWMLCYAVKSATGQLAGVDVAGSEAAFGGMLASPGLMLVFLALVVGIGVLATALGVQKGVEKITKVMMVALFFFLVVLAVHSLTLSGAGSGLEFYLVPDFDKLFNSPDHSFKEVVFAAMGQAFFTVSVGIGSMSIFGSYIGKSHALSGEAVRIAALDTLVALLAGLIIFPACFSYGVEPGAGPGLIFVTLPAVFAQMQGGVIWCTLFFLFMSCAALSTIIGVFENIMAFSIDQWGMTRKRAVAINGVAILVLALPCLLGFNVLSGVTVPGIGDIQAVEDFILSNNILPIGGMIFVLFCATKRGWGWKNFLAEANAGAGLRFPKAIRNYARFVLPLAILVVFVMGWLPTLQAWLG